MPGRHKSDGLRLLGLQLDVSAREILAREALLKLEERIQQSDGELIVRATQKFIFIGRISTEGRRIPQYDGDLLVPSNEIYFIGRRHVFSEKGHTQPFTNFGTHDQDTIPIGFQYDPVSRTVHREGINIERIAIGNPEVDELFASDVLVNRMPKFGHSEVGAAIDTVIGMES